MNLETRINASLRNPANRTYQDAEASVVAAMMQKYNCDVLVDVGCFHGGLAHSVLSKTYCHTAFIVDPVWEFLETAGSKIFTQVNRLETIHAAVMPQSVGPVTIRIPKSNSISASGIASKCPFDGEDHQVQSLGIDDLLSRVFLSCNPRSTYLKVDAEFMDLDIIKALCTRVEYLGDPLESHVPRVLEFEVIDVKRYNEEMAPTLDRLGYQFVELPKTHRYYSVILPHLSPGEAKVIAFEKFEVYDLKEGSLSPRGILSTLAWRDPRLKTAS